MYLPPPLIPAPLSPCPPLQVLVDVTSEEFETLMEVLSRLSYVSTEEGALQVATLISDQAELNTDFQVHVCALVCGNFSVAPVDMK